MLTIQYSYLISRFPPPHLSGSSSSRLLSRQRLLPGDARRVIVRPLTQAHRALSRALTEIQIQIIGRGGVIHAPVVPDGQVVLVLPPVAHLQVVVVDDQADEPVEQRAALESCHVVDLLHVRTDGEDGFPASHWVGADHGVDGLEDLADVLGGAALGGVELEAVAFGSLVEAGLCVSRGESLEKALVWGGDAVEELVAGSPEGVCDFISSLAHTLS